MTAPLTPYHRLLRDASMYRSRVEYPSTTQMLFYNGEEIDKGSRWDLLKLRERVKAADQLGYDVVLRAQDGDLKVLYRKRPNPPEYF